MPKNKVSDPITDQEIAFARLVLSGAMTDRQAAEAVGLNPDSAAYTKAKPRVHAYMLEHRAAVQQQLVQQEADGERRRNMEREKVLDRLWEIANLSPEMTRGSITGQVKAISMIVAIQGLIPDRRALSSEKKSAPALPRAEIYIAEWLRNQKATTHATTNDSQPTPNQEEEGPGVPQPEPAPAVGPERPAVSPNPGQSTPANSFTPSEAPEPYVPLFNSVPDLGIPFSLKRKPFNPFVRPR